MDVVFVVDASGSVGPSNFAKNLAFIADFTNQLDLADDSTKVALASFDSSYNLEFDFTSDANVAVQNIQSTVFTSGGTAIGNALQNIADDLDAGDLSWRPNTETWVLVFTDGVSGDSITTPQANLVAAKGNGQPTVNIMSIGIGGGVDVNQITAIASDPSYAFTISGYNQLNTIEEAMGTAACVP